MRRKLTITLGLAAVVVAAAAAYLCVDQMLDPLY